MRAAVDLVLLWAVATVVTLGLLYSQLQLEPEQVPGAAAVAAGIGIPVALAGRWVMAWGRQS